MKVKKFSAVLVAFLVAVTSMALPLSDTFNSVIKTTGSAKAVTKNSAVKMPTDAILFNTSEEKFKEIQSPEKGGFYYYNSYYNRSINFYDVNNNTVRKIKDYKDKAVYDVFATESKFYVVYRDGGNPNPIIYYVDELNIETEKVESTHNVTEFVADNYNSYIRTIGVDSKGRIYLTTFDGLKSEKNYTIHLLSKDYKELSSVDMEDDCFEYYGFDSSNGNFYFESYKTAKSQWGSSSGYRTLAFGNVTNNKITVSDEILDILYAKYVQYHYSSAIMLTEDTLAWTSSYNSTVNVLDSSKFDTKNPNNPPLLGSLSRVGYEGDDEFYSNIGARAVHNNLNNTTVIYMNDNRLMEFDSNYKHISTINTEYPVFALLNYGDDILAIEKDTGSNYYVEKFTWEFPTEINLSQTSATIKVGKSLSLSATSNALATYSYSWSSSNDKIASVTSEGKVYGNSVGTAVITAKTTNGVTANCTVTVEKNSSAPAVDKVKLSGQTSSNISKNDYYKWSSVITSNLSENADGTLNRVESTSNGVLVEKYSSDDKTLLSTKTIKNELSKFGGYFCGEDNNYIVFGENNTSENDSKEVVRVVKYSKDWTKISECKINGSNTTKPFDFGSLRMTELEGKLYIHTCHEMYADENGTNHQANMLFTIDESTMKTTDSMYDVLNLMNGYVSHSLNQFIKTDGDYIYRVDHSESNNFSFGDQYLSVNGITLTRYYKNDKSTSVKVTVPEKFDVNVSNYTGATVGGFEVGSGNCLIAFTRDISKDNKNRNVYLTVTDTLFNNTKKIALTNYKANNKVTCGNPQLAKINDNFFLVMWEEKNTTTNKVTTKAITVDASGNTISAKKTMPVRLSDCEPIVCSDGTVKWYVTDDSTPTLYSVNPYEIENIHEHNYTSSVTKEPTCTETGVKTYVCKGCGDTYTETIKAKGHSYVTTITPATMKSNGRKISKCSICNNVQYDNVISKISSVSISKTTFTYNGKTQTPTVTVKDSKKKTLKNKTDYTVTYSSSRKNVGRYSVKVKFKGNYSGKKTFYYNIAPKSTSVKSVKGLSKGMQVTLKLQKTQTTGYQIQYSTFKNFKNAKTVTVKNNVSAKKITKLSAKKKYFVRVRTYKITKFSGKNYNIYSSWSSAKTTVTK